MNADVQAATLLYNDRINTFRKLKQLDKQLDEHPTPEAVAAMAELRIRNLQAFAELQSLNDTGRFLCRHPLLFARSELAELSRLLKADPTEFLRRHKNVLDNIRRYRSFLKRADRADRRRQDQELLDRHQERDRLFRLVMEQKEKQ